MKLTFDLANPARAIAGLSISARGFLEFEGVACPSKEGPRVALASPESFEEALKNLVAALLIAAPGKRVFGPNLLTKEVGSRTAHRAFKRLRDSNSQALASWTWKELIERVPPGAKVDSLSSDLRGNIKERVLTLDILT